MLYKTAASCAILAIFLQFSTGLYAKDLQSNINKKDSSIAVSMLRLEIDPWPYVGMRIYTVGYLDHLLYIYPTKEFASPIKLYGIRINDTPDGQIARSDCPGNYVAVEGKLKRDISELDKVYIDEIFRIKSINGVDCLK